MVQCARIVMKMSGDYLCYSWGLGTSLALSIAQSCLGRVSLWVLLSVIEERWRSCNMPKKPGKNQLIALLHSESATEQQTPWNLWNLRLFVLILESRWFLHKMTGQMLHSFLKVNCLPMTPWVDSLITDWSSELIWLFSRFFITLSNQFGLFLDNLIPR